MAYDHFSIVRLAKFANRLDSSDRFSDANRIDKLIEKCLKREVLSKEESELLSKILKSDEHELDDGRFGLNDPMNPVYKAANLFIIADELESLGLHREAFVVEASFNPKIADLTQYLPPQTVAESLLRIFTHLLHRANIKDRARFFNSIKRGLVKINPVETSSKRNNPTSAIGAAINIVKNILMGQDLNTVVNILDALKRSL